MTKIVPRALSRRDVLKLLTAGATLPSLHPLSAAFASLVGSAALRSQAATPGGCRNYVTMYLHFGPPRWHYDLLLTPQSGAAPTSNSGLNNCFVNGQPAYRTTPVMIGGQTLHLPILWNASLPRPSGPSVPMTSLLNNMLCLRGINMGSDGHPNNAIKQFQPLAGAPSLHGLVADATARPMAAMCVDPFPYASAYLSQKGAGLITVKQTDALTQLLSPFQLEAAITQSPVYAKRQNLDEVINAALSQMQAASVARSPGASGLYHDAASARALIKQTFANLPGAYSTLVAKYRSLIARCAAQDIAGVNDQPVVGANLAPLYRLSEVSGIGVVPLENADLRSLLSNNPMLHGLAEGCAVAEYMIGQGLGAAVGTNITNPTNIQMLTGGRTVNSYYNTDDHNGGTAVSTLLFAFYYRALAACIFELSQALQAKGQWEQTVVHVAAEFTRTPKNNGAGSDHGWEGNCLSLYSGAIKQPVFIGNIKQEYGAQSTYNGTWGAGAPLLIDGTTAPMGIGHATSTVAELLGVAHPMANFASVISVSDAGGVQSLVEAPKNV